MGRGCSNCVVAGAMSLLLFQRVKASPAYCANGESELPPSPTSDISAKSLDAAPLVVREHIVPRGLRLRDAASRLDVLPCATRVPQTPTMDVGCARVPRPKTCWRHSALA